VKKNLVQLAVVAVTIAALVVVSWNLPYRAENDVYMTVAKSLGDRDQLDKIAFLSLPTRCKLPDMKPSPSTLGTDAIKESFFDANGPRSNPVRLTSLEGIYNVVSWEDTKRISDTDGMALRFRPAPKRVIILSRVGFNPGRTEALLCVESTDYGAFYLVRKGEEGWAVITVERAWGH